MARSAAGGGAARRQPVAAFLVPTRCQRLPRKPPHIILIHQESVVQPSLFPTLRYDHSVDPFFHSDDGSLHRMRVETYGGASWLTEFSLLAGVSTHAFGGMRQFVQTFTQNKLKDTLPQALERCGYRNVVFYPMLQELRVQRPVLQFDRAARDLRHEVAQGAKSTQERDRFYYENAMAEMDAALQVVAPAALHLHPDHVGALALRLCLRAGRRSAGRRHLAPIPEMHEYLRRVSMAKMDYDYLIGRAARALPAASAS